MPNKRICGWIDSNDDSLLTEISLSALISRISPLSALQSHIPSLYLGSSALSCLEITTSVWDLDLKISHEGMTFSSCPGC